MKIQKFNFKSIPIGLVYQTNDFEIFFGNKNSNVETIQKEFSQFHQQRVKQTHSDIVVQASNEIFEADAHFTSEKNMALVIATADCMPVLIFCHQTQRIASVHAGWKGVANQIVLKTLKQLISTGSSKRQFDFWVGPHILQHSFEVSSDVFQELVLASYELENSDFSFEQNNKFYVDLDKIVYSQIKKVVGHDLILNTAEIDTKTNDQYWSFRRDKEKAGRNLSFIALK